MSAVFEQVFLDALEDLREGRAEPIERYLELVPKSERAQLAAAVIGSVGGLHAVQA